MKPIHTLTWAVSAPILLFAGVSHAAIDISTLTDPACTGGFVLDSGGYIKCAASAASLPSCTLSANNLSVTTNSTATLTASCTQSPASYAWTVTGGGPTIGNASSATLTFGQAGTFGYKVIATNSTGPSPESNTVTITVSNAPANPPPGNCPATPAVIVAMGGQDVVSPIEFNRAFDGPGNKIDSRTEAGQIKAWEFDNNAYLNGKITGTHGNYGQNIKDWSISACPGDFSTTLASKCRKIGYSDVSIWYHATDATKGCLVPAGQKMYLNIRATEPGLPAGYVVGNVPSSSLP